jgi:hypothetical protein
VATQAIKTAQIHIRVEPGEKKKLTQAAKKAGFGLSTWLLRIGLEKAGK